MNSDLKPFGIRFMIVEPGAFRTDFFNAGTSFAFSDLEIDDYKQQRELLYNTSVSQNQKQPGDPAKFAKAVMTAAGSPNPPLRLLVGKAAVGIIEQYYKNRFAEFEAWKDVSADSDFD